MIPIRRKPPLRKSLSAPAIFILCFLILIGILSPRRAAGAQPAPARPPSEPAPLPPSPSGGWTVEDLPGGPKRIPKALSSALRSLADGAYEEAAGLAEGFLRRNREVFPERFSVWKARARIIAARAWVESGRASDALRALETGGGDSRISPPHAVLDAHILWIEARALEGLGRYGDAAEVYDSIGGSGSPAPEVRAAAARAWFRAGDCARGVSGARALKSGNPRRPGLRILQGRCLEEAGRPAEALRLYFRIWLRHPLDAAAAEAAKAMDRLRGRGLDLPRLSTSALLGRARTLHRGRRIAEASRAWKMLLGRRISPAVRVEAVFSLGLNLYFLRETRQAAERLRQAADQGGKGERGRRAKALYYLARTQLRLRDGTGFRKVGSELIAEHPGSPWARRFLYLQARVVEDDGRLEEALGRYRRLAKKHPGTRQGDFARWRIGWIHFRRKRYIEAERVFSALGRARARRPVGQAALYWAGRAAEDRAAHAEAKRYYRDAGGRTPASYYGQMAYERLGRSGWPFRDAGASARFLKRPALTPQGKRILREADRLVLAGLFRAGADVLKEGVQIHPYFRYQRARFLHRARDYNGAFRVLSGPVFWRMRIGGRASPEEFRRMMHPFDRRALGLHQAAAGPGGRKAAPADPLLVSAVTLAESLFDPNALSVAGARGLMQLMPATARRIARRLGLPRPSPADLFRPDLNVRLGSEFLGRLLAHFRGARAPAVAAYNAGLKAAGKWWRKHGHLDEASFIAMIPYRETRRYTRRVLGYYRQYRLTYPDVSSGSPRAAEKGGSP